MDLEEIETVYAQEVEQAGKVFIDGIKNKKDVRELEKEYKKKLQESRNSYYKSFHRALHRKQKKQGKKKKREEKTKPFFVEPGTFELGPFTKLKIRLHLAWFKSTFAFRNWRRKHTPAFISFGYIRTKMTLKRWSARTGNFFESIGRGIKESVRVTITTIGKGVKHAYTKLAELPEKIINTFAKKKKAEEKKKEETNSNQNK